MTDSRTPDTSPDPVTDIDRSAPVVASRSVVVDAPIDLVWSLHVDVTAWPR